jgi:hypothetical protein
MTNEPRDEATAEEQEDVEGHGALMGEPALAPALHNDDSGDDVEGHGALMGEPALEPALHNDESDDDVEGHGMLNEPAL